MGRLARGGAFAVSPSQHRLWRLHCAGGRGSYNVVAARKLLGDLDVPVLTRSLGRIAARHEALRTSFEEATGSPHQLVASEVSVELPVVDVAGGPRETRDRELARLRSEVATHRFDLTTAPLFTGRLIRLGDAEHDLLLAAHHIVCDGWSMNIVFEELAAQYTAGATADLPEPAVQLVDFVAWQLAQLERAPLAATVEKRQRELGPLLRRPPPSSVGASVPAKRHHFSLPRPVRDGVWSRAKQFHTTPFAFLLAVWTAVLRDRTGRTDFLVASPVANRTREEVMRTVGLLANVALLRVDVSGAATLGALVDRVRGTVDEAYAAQPVPLERILARLGLREDAILRDLGVDTMFAFRNFPQSPLRLPGVETQAVPFETVSTECDLGFSLTPTDTGIDARFTYATDAFDEPELADWEAAFRAGLGTALRGRNG